MNFSVAILTMISAMLFLARQCDSDDVPGGTPGCVEVRIREILNQDASDPPAKLYSYIYNEQKVYYIPPVRCCDFFSELYDENCNLVCAPDGGIHGGGDGQCPDFFSARTDEKLVWEDKRK